MKALTLTQPWASLVACGAKKIETRSWRTSYTGPLAIHAAKSFPKWAREFAAEPVCRDEFGCEEPKFPLGVVIATVRLVRCVRTDHHWVYLKKKEREFGDYAPGRFAWLLEDLKLLPMPVPARGALSLWDWEPTI